MKRLALSVGEPAGIGPDIVIAAAQQHFDAEIVVFADSNCLLARAKQCQLPLTLIPFSPKQYQTHQRGQLSIVDVPLATTCLAGHANPDNSHSVIAALQQASQACLDKHCDALLTAPIQKNTINDAGINFSGHTEWLADFCGIDMVTMLFISDNLHVSLQTTHLALCEVTTQLQSQAIVKRIQLANDFLQRYVTKKENHIAVCGVNPHAGENGYLGNEDETIIKPAIEQCQQLGLNAHGPLAADSVFSPQQRQHYDLIHAMYHDQGLAPFKALTFNNGINVTCGLPFIRTSVDHGTALSLAGSGRANCDSLLYAIERTLSMI